MAGHGHVTISKSKLQPNPRSGQKEEDIPSHDPIEAILLVPLYLVIIAWVLNLLGLWNH